MDILLRQLRKAKPGKCLGLFFFEAVARIRSLYAIEHEGKLLDASARSELRQSKAVPCLQELKSWLEKQRAEVLPKCPMAEAIYYTFKPVGSVEHLHL